ncbi:MAG TPA: EAL domain-containing protein [Burkholderiales bacterium]|nr:EAL domain-containing protein [Burkholderiales bacterium]
MADVVQLLLITAAVVYLVMVLLSRRHTKKILELKENEARFRGLTELSADWFWETDAEHRITWLSGGGPVALFFGGTKAYGRCFWEIPRVEVDPGALGAHLERLSGRLPFFDLEIARADERGARQIHIISGQSRLDEAGNFLGYRGVGHDVTEQRLAERRLLEAKGRLERALDGGNLAEWHFDAQSGDLQAGDGWVRFLGHDQSPITANGIDLFGRIHPEDRERASSAWVRALKGDAPEYEAEFRIAMASGAWKWLHARGRVTERDAAGRALRMSGTIADVDQRKRAEGALAERERRFHDVAMTSQEYVWETDADGRFTYLSERAESLLGYARAELLGRRLADFMPPGEACFTDSQEGCSGFVHRFVTRGGAPIWQSVSAVPQKDSQGRFCGLRGTAADVTARKSAETRIEHLTTRDALTGLPNRALAAERAAQAILGAARGRTELALLALDLDRFRLVNEALGHQAGDALLRAVAERLQGVMRDEWARTGGDEFVLLAPGLRSAEEAAALARRVLGVLARPFALDGHTVTAGASIGIALYPRDGRDFAELAKNAEAALQHAKERGRGTFSFYTPQLSARASERLRVEGELRGALARGELALHWQPVVRGRGSVIGAEALVRWRHPARGLLMPEDFVPLAEECGLIGALGEWTLERALSQAGAWQRTLPGAPWFAVNVSAPELAQGDAFVDRLRTALEANGLEGSRIELEVTERVLVSHIDENLETMRRIGELGVRFSIDDFGTGYSSLAYLRRLPVDKLKIDRAFVRAIDTDPADEAIVRTIAALASTLGLAVAAEGVERKPQLDRLLALGCEHWQGHHFSPPLAPVEFEALLKRANSGQGRAA